MTIAASPRTDWGELAEFLQGVGCLDAEGMDAAMAPLWEELGRPRRSSAAVMTRRGPVPRSEAEGLCHDPGLDPLYRLLCASVPGFEEEIDYQCWYCDMSARVRRGMASCTMLLEEDGPAAAAALAWRGPQSVIIGDVATRPDCRHRGYARRVLTDCLVRAEEWGLVPYLITAEDALIPFYEHLGFTVHGRRTLLTL